MQTFRRELQKRDIASDTLSDHPDVARAVTFKPGFSSEYNVRQDVPSLEDDPQRNRPRRDSEAEESDPYETEAEDQEGEEDDSDMFMEPLELEKPEKPAERQPVTVRPDAIIEATTFARDNHPMGQHFYPSFAPVFSLGHSRPHQLFHQQEPFYTSKSRAATTFSSDYNPFRNSFRDTSYKVPINFDDDAISNNILGSGNFGILRGGTYYNEEDDYGLFNSHYSNNGHGRPYYSNPRPQKYTNGDFFSNFRDFAEINTPTKTSYSQYIVVYVNKNATKSNDESELTAASVPSSVIAKPKNIFEQLSLLDQADDESHEAEEKKTSLHKRKLALLKQEELNKQKKSYSTSKESSKDFLEPLLALS
ncbi:hypothetical protein RUM43_007010 [Polyplax serrata]|uniref:Uncharacterized protein n=1 Tax=Polyplax serrata TaxID=468196 RepID=A0AAN8PLF0_POLSC